MNFREACTALAKTTFFREEKNLPQQDASKLTKIGEQKCNDTPTAPKNAHKRRRTGPTVGMLWTIRVRVAGPKNKRSVFHDFDFPTRKG